jgi:osmoprotectant transport system ATP-binding protein
MDEPFGALDTITRSKIQAEFKGLDELKRKTIIMVTHDVQEAFELGDRICLMDKGSIAQLGTPGDLLFKPADKFTTEFLKEQRLLLEFKAVMPPPPPKGGTFELHGNVLPADASLWFLLEQLKFTKGENISIRDSEHKEIGKLGFEELMSAFYQYKKPSRHE